MLLTVLFAGALGATADAPAVRSPEAIQIIDRAVRMAAGIREYSAETKQTTEYEGGKAAKETSHRVIQVAFRAPAYFWSFNDGGPGFESVMLADGQSRYEFYSGTGQAILKRDLADLPAITVDAYPDLELSILSPAATQVISLARARSDADATLVYRGRESVGNVLCDVVESKSPVKDGYWESRSYIGVDDALLRRQITTSIVNGAMQMRVDELIRIKQADPNEQFTVARLEAVTQAISTDGKAPKIENAYYELGRPLPDVTAVLLDGRPLRWQDYKGRVVVLETWATWCGLCKQAMPFYGKVSRAVADQNVVFVALSFDQDQALYEKWVKENRGKYDFVYARAAVTEKDWKQELDKLKGTLPAFYVLGRDGKVAAAYAGYGYGRDKEDPRLLAALSKVGVKH